MRDRFASLKRDGRPDLSAKLVAGPRQRRHTLDDEQRKAELSVEGNRFRSGEIRREARIRDY